MFYTTVAAVKIEGLEVRKVRSVLGKIKKIRQGSPINIDYQNNNKYRVLWSHDLAEEVISASEAEINKYIKEKLTQRIL